MKKCHLWFEAIVVISNIVQVDDGAIRSGVAEASLSYDDVGSVRTSGLLQRTSFLSLDAIFSLVAGEEFNIILLRK